MIRYASTRESIRARIDQVSPTWMIRAAALTDAAVAAGGFDGAPSAIWSEIREVYVGIQLRKCVFCERAMAALPLGGSEQAVEHYRPKGRTRPWKPSVPEEFWASVGNALRDGNADGYFWLAYNFENYATSCAICNSRLKSDFFPIFGEPGAASRSPRQLRSEKPALPYPIGDVDDDLEEILTFDGIRPIPARTDKHSRRRAFVTIRFFSLDTREELLQERAKRIVDYGIFRRAMNDATIAATAGALLATHLTDGAPHANCLRAFDRLVTDDPVRANQVADDAMTYLLSVGAI